MPNGSIPFAPGFDPRNGSGGVHLAAPLAVAKSAWNFAARAAVTGARQVAPVLTRAERIAKFYEALRVQAPASSAEEALARVRGTLDRIEDAFSGVPKASPPPPPGMSDGRMYPPLDDFVTRNPDGSISARTRGHNIEIGKDGSTKIVDRKSGKVEFEQPGATK